jgi:hypothetical protein
VDTPGFASFGNTVIENTKRYTTAKNFLNINFLFSFSLSNSCILGEFAGSDPFQEEP